MNYLKRRIGIFYKTDEWYKEMCLEIFDNFPQDSIREIRTQVIELKDCTTIEFVTAPCGTYEDGRRFDEIYAEFNMPDEEVEMLWGNVWPGERISTVKNGYDILNHIDRRKVKSELDT